MSSRHQRVICVAVAALLLMLIPVAAQAQMGTDELDYPLQQLAAATKEIMRQRGDKTIAVGEFTGPPSLASAAGAGIKVRLEQELRRLDVRRRTIGAPLSLSGSYRINVEQFNNQQQTTCVIEARFLDANGNLLSSLNQPVKYQRTLGTGAEAFTLEESLPMSGGVVTLMVRNGGTMAALLGTTIAEQKSPDREQPWLAGIKPEKVTESFEKPTAVLVNNQTAVRASADSPFQVAVLVGGQPRKLSLIDGHPFVELAKGETFSVQVSNQARFSAGAKLLLDGVNNFAFSQVLETEGDRQGLHKYQRWILAPGRATTVAGWHIDNSTVHEFKVTDFIESASAKVGGTSGVGTITAIFEATWIMGREKPPADEPVYAASAEPGEGIGFGARRGQRVQEDNANRMYGRERAVITIRYQKPPAEGVVQ